MFVSIPQRSLMSLFTLRSSHVELRRATRNLNATRVALLLTLIIVIVRRVTAHHTQCTISRWDLRYFLFISINTTILHTFSRPDGLQSNSCAHSCLPSLHKLLSHLTHSTAQKQPTVTTYHDLIHDMRLLLYHFLSSNE